MISLSKLDTPVYLHTLDAYKIILYYLKISGKWNHISINYIPAVEYTYLNLGTEATICQSPKYTGINTQTNNYDTKCKICGKNEIGDEFHYLFICPCSISGRRQYIDQRLIIDRVIV